MSVSSRIVSKWVLLLACILGLVSCENEFDSFSDTGDDESLLYAAKEAVRDADYTAAIEACGSMSDGFLETARAVDTCASAYAGRCGYGLISMVNDIEDYVTAVPAEKLFHWFVTEIPTASALNASDCATAEDLLRTLGAAADRSDDQNAFMVLLSIRTISTALKVAADANNDEAVDGGFDACAISAANAQIIGSAFWEFEKSLDQLSSNSFYADLDTAADAICTALNGLGTDLCGATSPEGLAAGPLRGARSLMKEGALVGVDQCGGDASLLTCNCP